MKTTLTVLSLLLSSVFAGAQVLVNDSLALVDLYNRTDGPNWSAHTNWLTKKPVSTWYGITTANGKVTAIQLEFNRLKGEFPASIGGFDSLVTLNLYANSLRGNIPVPIGNLVYLQSLYLSDNKLSGEIPVTIEKLGSLINLNLSKNRLTGTIPDSLAKCKNLATLTLSYNQLTGTIPASFKKLTQLTWLILSGNQLGPTLTDVFAVDAPLTYFQVAGCGYTGKIPDFLSRFTTLFSLDLSVNQFTGTIPVSFSKLRQLDRLYLSGNQLTGGLPPLNPDINVITADYNQLSYDDNPQYHKRGTTIGEALFGHNRFTFNGLEYLVERYNNVRYQPQAQIAVHYFGDGLAVSAGGTLANNTYTWFQPGSGPVARTTGDSTFHPLQSGRYYAHVSNAVVAGLILYTDTVTYTMPLVKSSQALSVSPNPAGNIVRMAGLNEKSNVKITVTDMSGHVWLTVMSGQQPAVKADVSRLKAGNYLLNADDGKSVQTLQFVKE